MKTRARVTITVELDLPSTWGPECSLAQVFEQAAREAKTALRKGLVIDFLTVGHEPGKVPARIVSEPSVTAVLVQE